MDTTVITVDEADYGVGVTDRVVFVDSKYMIDETGFLHVHRQGADGNIGSFPNGTWRAVLRGTPRSDADRTEVRR